MGCFLACFGFSKKRRRRRPANRAPSVDQSHGSYRPLDSEVSIISENPNISESHEKGQERSSHRIKKKVSFNLNVKTYEPLPSGDFSSYFSESDEENKEQYEKMPNCPQSGGLKTNPYPLGHRYQNCTDVYNEDDDIKLDDSDLDQDDEEEDLEEEEEEEYDGGDEEIGQEDKWVDKTTSLADSLDKELDKQGLSNSKTVRDQSKYVFSVLNPVENLSQWKAVKARPPPPQLKQQRKENVEVPLISKPSCMQSEPLLKYIAVDASLSDWLVSSKAGCMTSNLQRRS